MTITDQITIVKRIAKAWKDDRYNYEKEKVNDSPEKDLLGISMLANRYALEFCGLTLNEIIALGEADDLEKAIDKLFSQHS